MPPRHSFAASVNSQSSLNGNSPYALAGGIVRRDGALGLIAVVSVGFLVWFVYYLVSNMSTKMDELVKLKEKSTEVHQTMLRVMIEDREPMQSGKTMEEMPIALRRSVQDALSPL